MLTRVVTIVFYVTLALFFFGVGFPYLELLAGLCAAVLAIVHAMG